MLQSCATIPSNFGKRRNILSSFLTCSMLFLLTLSLPTTTVNSAIVVTEKERQCLKATEQVFANNNELIAARHNYATSMDTEMTSTFTMTAKYPEDKLLAYANACLTNGGKFHTIKIDFFDCKLGKIDKDVELTLKNFANCLADSSDCETFDQENLLEEAWDELGLHCILEDKSDGGDSSNSNYDPSRIYTNDDDNAANRIEDFDDDLAQMEKKDTEEGADDLNKKEKAAEYTPKEQLDKNGNKKKKRGGGFGRFLRFVLFVGIVVAIGYYVYDRRLIPGIGGAGRRTRLPWGGVTTSRFQGGGGGAPSGYVSNYNLLSGEEEMNFGAGDHELQLS